MMLAAKPQLLCALAAVLLHAVSVESGAAGAGAASDFDAEVTEKFISSVSVDGTWPNSKVAWTGEGENTKPYMVIVTQPWCGACKNLKGQVNSGTKVKGMLDNFNVVHAVGDDGKKWQESGHGYVPQTYFYDASGEPITDAVGPNSKYAHFYGDEGSLAKQMSKLL